MKNQFVSFFTIFLPLTSISFLFHRSSRTIFNKNAKSRLFLSSLINVPIIHFPTKYDVLSAMCFEYNKQHYTL